MAAPVAATSPALKRFGAPDPGSTIQDVGQHWKLAQRVEKTMLTCINAEPKQLDPRSLLVAPANRDGAPPNVQYVHFGILRSLQKAGFDRTRPQVGICIQVKSSEGKERLIQYNKAFSSGNHLLPTIDQEKVMYATLAGTHLNLCLRILQAGLASPACDTAKLVASGSSLAEVVHNGHKWWILPEDTPVNAQVEVSLWRNMDQNENQSLHEIEILRNIMATCQELSRVKSKLALGDILARAQSRSPHRVSDKALQSIAQYYLRALEDKQPDLALELQEFHSARVNPRELQMSASFFATVANEKGLRGFPFLRHYLLTTNYTSDKARASVGQADVCNFLETSAIVSLGKKTDIIRHLETLLRDARLQYLPILQKELSGRHASLELVDLADCWIRCAFARPFRANSAAKTVASGKFSPDKALQLAQVWGASVDSRFPDLQFLKEASLQVPADPKKGPDSAELLDSVDIGAILGQDGELHPGDVDTTLPETFSPGDRVVTVRRTSLPIPLPGHPAYRKDIDKGTLAIIQGYADPEQRFVFIRVVAKVPGASGPEEREVVAKVGVGLVLRESPQVGQDAPEIEPLISSTSCTPASASGSSGPSGQHKTNLAPKFSFVNKDIPEDEITPVLPEPKWNKLLDHDSVLEQLWFLKGKAAILASAIVRSLPEFGPNDLMVIHRQISGKTSWRSEVWTMRAFDAKELVIPVVSTELKDRFWTRGLHHFLGLPNNGPGRHPEGKQLAFDGRGKSVLASEGLLDDQEHRGLLCWAIERDSGDEWNLEPDQISGEISVALKMVSGKKKKITTSWPSDELPVLLVLVNPEAIPQHTRLFVRSG